MRRDAWAASDSTWRHGLLQRLDDINSELERQAPAVLARQAERSEAPTDYQRQCQAILERLRTDCAALDQNSTTTAAKTLAAPTMAPPAIPSHTSAPPALPGSPSLGALRPMAIDANPAFASTTGSAPVAERDNDAELGETDAITNESILAYANSSGQLADHMASRLRVGLWIATASCGAVVASVSALFVATLMDASQSSSTVHALPASIAQLDPGKTKASLSSDYRLGDLADARAAGTPMGWLRASLTPSPSGAAKVEPAVASSDRTSALSQTKRPQLIADLFVRREDIGAIPIGLRLEASNSEDYSRHTILIRDLPDGASVSHGAKVGPRTWALPPQAMEHAKLALADDARETVDIRVELVDAVGEPVTRTRFRVRLLPKSAPEAVTVTAALDADRRRLEAMAAQAASSRSAAPSADPPKTTLVPRVKTAKAPENDQQSSGSGSPSTASKQAVAAKTTDDEDDAKPKPRKPHTAKVPSPPSALGARVAPPPATPATAAAKPAPAAAPSKWLGTAPEWSPFSNGPSNSR